MVVAGCSVTSCRDAVALPPPLHPHCLATTYIVFPENASEDVVNTDVESTSPNADASVDAPVSPTLLTPADLLHLSDDVDNNSNRSPGGKTPCVLRIGTTLCNHGTAMDDMIMLNPTMISAEMVAGYFRDIIA
jgi:hypothetical protein